MECFLDTSWERFEYETNMLIECPQKSIAIKQYPIETIYINEGGKVNRTSHFIPLRDSLKKYSLFFKFIAASISSFAIDIGAFTIFNIFVRKACPLHYISIDTYLARAVSSVFNYMVNKKKVFKSNAAVVSSTVKYFVLSIIQASLSAVLVSLIMARIIPSAFVSKMLVDTAPFFASFFIQRGFVFKNGKRMVKNELFLCCFYNIVFFLLLSKII